jgi:hypothetical protein
MAELVTQDSVRIECPIWHSPLFYIVPGGLEIRCKSCRKAIHTFSREKLESMWDELNHNPTVSAIATESL